MFTAAETAEKMAHTVIGLRGSGQRSSAPADHPAVVAARP